MKKNKKNAGMRKIFAISSAVVTVVVLVVLLVLSMAGTQSKHLATAEFLKSQFVLGEYLEGFSPGVPEYGFSLEAVSQLSQTIEVDSSLAIKFLLESEPDFLYSAETGEIIPGLAGKYLFASKVTGAVNGAQTQMVVGSLSELFNDDGTLAVTAASTFDYAWMALGLYAQDQKDMAKTMSATLTTLAREDGGFGFDSSEFTTASSTDATAMAIMALELTKGLDPELTAEKQGTIDAALDYLDASLVDQSYFMAFDAVDINGTALALMAYIATRGELNESVYEYLVAQIQEDGGIGSPWVENSGDRFATAQGYLALEGKSYLSLLGR
jgi:hypothetical protein